MPYQVRWQLVGRSERPLDSGHVQEACERYGDAAEAINEFLRSYPEVKHCSEEGYWLARRSEDADLAVWVWIERYGELDAGLVRCADAPASGQG